MTDRQTPFHVTILNKTFILEFKSCFYRVSRVSLSTTPKLLSNLIHTFFFLGTTIYCHRLIIPDPYHHQWAITPPCLQSVIWHVSLDVSVTLPRLYTPAHCYHTLDPLRVLFLSLPGPRVYQLPARMARRLRGSLFGGHGNVLAEGHRGP